MSSLSEFSRDFNAFKRNMVRTIRGFLPAEKGRLQRLARATVQTSVYDVYSPTVYERTGRLKKSIRAYLPDESNPLVLYIDSDPGVAPAKLGYIKDGYAQFVAGEGPGIGFLARTVPQLFPRPFHESIYRIVDAEVNHRFMEKIDRVIAKL